MTLGCHVLPSVRCCAARTRVVLRIFESSKAHRRASVERLLACGRFASMPDFVAVVQHRTEFVYWMTELAERGAVAIRYTRFRVVAFRTYAKADALGEVRSTLRHITNVADLVTLVKWSGSLIRGVTELADGSALGPGFVVCAAGSVRTDGIAFPCTAAGQQVGDAASD